MVKKEVLQEAKRTFERKKKKAQDLSFTVIGKEINLENMVKKEEQTKEEKEAHILEQKISEETFKAECLEKSFHERELDEDLQETEKESMSEINEVQLEARKKIQNSRLKLKRTIQQMKMKSKSKNQYLSGQLKQIRSKMSKEIMLANKNGDVGKCRRGKMNADFRESYCNENFVDDWTRNSDCKGEDFCYVCCETEFGAMFVTERDNCYKMCDKKPKKVTPIPPPKPTIKAIQEAIQIAKEPEPDKKVENIGKWVWAPREKTTK